MEDCVTVKTFQSRFNAEIAQAFLAAQGIKAFIGTDTTRDQYAKTAFLKVHKKDLQKAKELLTR